MSGSVSQSLAQLHIFPTGPPRACLLLVRVRHRQPRHARIGPQAALLEPPRRLAAGPANSGHGRAWIGSRGRRPAAMDRTEEERINAWHAGADECNVELEPRPERHPDAVDCQTG